MKEQFNNKATHTLTNFKHQKFMKTVNWILPFANMHYLNSLTEELANNPMVVLITGIQSERGEIDSCNIRIRESEDGDDVLLLIGATIGAHSVAYAMEIMEARKEAFQNIAGLCMSLLEAIPEGLEIVEESSTLDLPEVILLPERAGQVIDEEGKEVVDLFEIEEQQQQDAVLTVVKEEEDVVVEEQEDIQPEEEKENIEEEEEQEEDIITRAEIGQVINDTPDSPAKSLLRRILENFKKIK